MKLFDCFKGKPTWGAANRVVVTDIEKLKADDRQDLSKQLDIPKSVLKRFLGLLKIRQVDVASTDSTLRAMAKQYTIFYERVVQVAAADSVVTELQSQAVGALVDIDRVTGKLTILNQVFSGGAGPVHLAGISVLAIPARSGYSCPWLGCKMLVLLSQSMLRSLPFRSLNAALHANKSAKL